MYWIDLVRVLGDLLYFVAAVLTLIATARPRSR